MTSEEQIRKIVHEEIVKYHYYGIRHSLVLTSNRLTQEYKFYLKSGSDAVLIERIRKDLKITKSEIAAINKLIEKVGKFDTKV